MVQNMITFKAILSFIVLRLIVNAKKSTWKKTVDEVINSMKDEDFDRFTRAVIDSVHKKQGYDGLIPAQMP